MLSAQKRDRERSSPSSRQPITLTGLGETAFPSPTVSTGRRPLSYLYLSTTTIILLQVPSSNTLYLGMYELNKLQLPIYYSLLWHIQKFYEGGSIEIPPFELSQRSDTQYLSATGRLFHCFPKRDTRRNREILWKIFMARIVEKDSERI